MNAYMFAIAVGAAMLLIAALISNMISYQGGANPTDPRQRKMVFWETSYSHMISAVPDQLTGSISIFCTARFGILAERKRIKRSFVVLPETLVQRTQRSSTPLRISSDSS